MKKTVYRLHAVQRMFERSIPLNKVRQTLERGETIEDYSNEMSAPSRLILGGQGRNPLHVVVSEGVQADEAVVITAYVPEPSQWTRDFKRRRSP
ncbi:MAG: DUF4258 domain-containing protein [Chloroflexi bacterium]|nr:DUF4258 domain-containing protein [Chloroflexota bacterium]